MEEIVKKESQEIASADNEVRIKLQNFVTLLHKEPNKNEIRYNKYSNSNYLPISFLEMALDEMFFGLWETTNFTTKTIVNEEVGSLELRVFHPVAKMWITRVGAGAVMIQQKAESEITDIGAKIKNTMTKDYPHLKAECFRNACLSLGKSFGRDLNREFQDQYTPIIKETIIENQALIEELQMTLKDFTNYDELKSKAKGLKEAYVKKGLSEKTAFSLIVDKLEALKD
ncbi:MAG: hypothetical protein AB1695_12600 [Stygiobacter sp.]